MPHNRIEKPDHTVDDSYRNDDGTGNRYKKKSFNWYKQVIATNGETLKPKTARPLSPQAGEGGLLRLMDILK